MSEFLGSRISLISKSNIRYVGTLHEINSEESTVSLENVQSFGTEGREGEGPAVPASDQVYEYIVFRGSDVKDLRIDQPPAPQPQPPAVPNDPAILGARPRPDAQGPANQRPPPAGPPGHPGAPGYGYNNFYGAPGSWGRGGPVPGAGGYGGMHYPPHPNGWGPGGPGGPGNFPPGPGGPPAPWGNYPYPPQHGWRSRRLSQDQKNVGAKTSQQLPRTAEADSKPAGPKSEAIEKSTPAAPLSNGQAPTTKFQPPVTKSEAASKSLPPPTDAAISDATEAAKAAVALAMARLNAASEPVANPIDNLSNRVNDMRINAATRAPQAPRGGRNQGGRSNRKADVPTEDFDFASANAKFKKDDIKPTTEPAANEEKEVATPNEPTTPAGPVYNKSTSFFDNISSEAKERAANGGHKPGGREWRGEEQRKNMETFGQGSVDGGYRNYRGRGRGGFRGRGRGGQNRGGYQNRQPRPQVEN
ncbi:Protein SCD6 [Ceratocystis lukuohia]|uniref:Protein SCD6 n=1 Tax=Ceratocystis lukuohia TaxID=2019550 RepID=A0ABR4MT02_9PEZI